MENTQVLVVGAGIAGLTAAYYLKEAGFHPVVIEKSNRVGGRMISDKIDGFTLDGGAQFLMESYPILNSLIDKVGLRQKYVLTSQYMGVVKGGKIHQTQRTKATSVVTGGVFSVPTWLNFMMRSFLLMNKTKKLDPDDYTTWSHYDDQDLESYSYAYFGKEVTDVIIDPLFESLFFQPIRDISKALGLMIIDSFFFRETKVTTALVDGIAILPECLGSQLDVRRNTTVQSVNTRSGRVEVETDQGTFTADRLILAAPATITRKLYQPQDDTEGELLATPYSSTLVVYFALDESYQVDPAIQQNYGVSISKMDRNNIAAFTVEASKERTRAVGGSLFANFLCHDAGTRMFDWEEDKIVQEVLADFEKYLPGAGKHLRFSKIYRWKDALAYSPIGRSKAVARYRKGLSPNTRVYLAGDYMGLACTEGAAETGRWAAYELIKNLR